MKPTGKLTGKLTEEQVSLSRRELKEIAFDSFGAGFDFCDHVKSKILKAARKPAQKKHQSSPTKKTV